MKHRVGVAILMHRCISVIRMRIIMVSIDVLILMADVRVARVTVRDVGVSHIRM